MQSWPFFMHFYVLFKLISIAQMQDGIIDLNISYCFGSFSAQAQIYRGSRLFHCQVSGVVTGGRCWGCQSLAMNKHQLIQWHQSSGQATLKFVLKKSFTSMGQTQCSKTVQEGSLHSLHCGPVIENTARVFCDVCIERYGHITEHCKLFGWNIGVWGGCQSVACFWPSPNLTLVRARVFLCRILVQWSCSTKFREDLRIPHTTSVESTQVMVWLFTHCKWERESSQLTRGEKHRLSLGYMDGAISA